ncbi:MAG: haloalkane dehalogenase [Mycobacterium sp.]|nr:MAG: haloalkane dehalogenase [Mycobacterium sp.]PJE23993.1 MAG: haloalkane dehalogenase [Mycobacterium sp.]
MIVGEETFDGTWPFEPRYSSRAGFEQHYVDEGPAGVESGGDALVLLHGEPTWGYLWRHLIAPLSATRRVVVPDHMGFGKSADPQDRSYSAVEHIANLESLLVDELELRDITLVLHDWGGPIGTGFALNHPDRVRRIVAINTFLPLGLAGQLEAMAANFESAWFTWALRANADGSLEQVLGNAGDTVAHLMLALQTIARPAIVTPTWVRAYSALFTDRTACQGAIRFPQQIVAPDGPLPPALDPAAVAALQAKPAMLAVGLQDTALLPTHVVAAFRAAYPTAPVVELPEAGHFPPEDTPDTVLALLRLFMQIS